MPLVLLLVVQQVRRQEGGQGKGPHRDDHHSADANVRSFQHPARNSAHDRPCRLDGTRTRRCEGDPERNGRPGFPRNAGRRGTKVGNRQEANEAYERQKHQEPDHPDRGDSDRSQPCAGTTGGHESSCKPREHDAELCPERPGKVRGPHSSQQERNRQERKHRDPEREHPQHMRHRLPDDDVQRGQRREEQKTQRPLPALPGERVRRCHGTGEGEEDHQAAVESREQDPSQKA